MIDQKNSVESIKPIESVKYKNISLDHLIMYTIDYLNTSNIDLSSENITVAAFKMFPDKFSLSGYNNYPDGKRVHDSIFHCTYKSKRWLIGKKKHGYALSEKGKLAVKEAELLLTGKKAGGKIGKTKSQTRRKEQLLAEIRVTKAYTKVLESNIDEVTESEFCYLLQGTLDTTVELLSRNFERIKIYAEDLGDETVVTVLKSLKLKFKNLIE